MSDRFAGLYLHIPFCSRVCPYCDFAVRTGDAARRRRFVDHLIAEIELYANYPLQFDTIYFGGGTPSLIEPEDLRRILDMVHDRLEIANGCRTFLEANPENASQERLTDWRELGVETLSLGVQSFDAGSLEFLGRRHDPAASRLAVERAHAAGFETISVDLIYGLPGQTDDEWRRELDTALSLEPHHLSCYQLTIHERTRFGLLHKRGRLTELPIDGQAGLFRRAHQHLNDRGLQGYEVSQFAASPRHRSRHNMKYWNHTPYLGLGPSAHSYHDDRRWWNIPRTDPYQESISSGRPPIEADERLSTGDLVLESLMTGLRTYSGADLGQIRDRHGLDLAHANRMLIDQLENEGFARLVDDRLVPSLDGLAVADGMARRFEIPND